MYIGDTLTWNVIVNSLSSLNPTFKVTDLQETDFWELLSPLLINNAEFSQMTLVNLLERLTAADLQWVKVFLAWELFEGYSHLPYGTIEKMCTYELAFAILNKHYHKTAFLMGVIFTQIERTGLVVKLCRV